MADIETMKFAHEFKNALEREGFPPHWIETAVPYSQLKKCIKKVERELSSFGLDNDTLRQLLPSNNDATKGYNPRNGSGNGPVAFQYDFEGDHHTFQPKLTIFVQVADGIAIDATLSDDTKEYLGAISHTSDAFKEHPHSSDANRNTGNLDMPSFAKSAAAIANGAVQQIEVPLTFDAEFFGLIQGDLSGLDALHAEEQKAMTEEISALGQEVARLSQPTSKTDLYRWRELFDIYLQAGVFFSTNELDGGSRNSLSALAQLKWFQDEVIRRNIPKSFKTAASRQALHRFTTINLTLLRNLKFQEINQLAIFKILKKFDKRTSLGVKTKFPKLIKSDSFMSEKMAKEVCAQVSTEVVKIVPQLDDYLCPVCLSIAYKPIRLTCGHVYCIRCMIKMQQSKAKHCPLCRNNAIMDADSANLDLAHMRFLQLYFPKESKAKQKENELAVGVDKYGEEYLNKKCSVM